MRSRIDIFKLRSPKGETYFPESGIPQIQISSSLRRGVSGTLDILAHELAHAICGYEEKHGDRWAFVYQDIYEAACKQPTITRTL